MINVDRSLLVDILCDQLQEYYVFPDVAGEIADVLRERLARGRHTGLDDEDFAEAVTEDLRSVNGDKHLGVRHSPDAIPGQEAAECFDADLYRAEARLGGYGFARVERLDGNVGHLDTREMVSPEIAGPAAVAAMNLVAPTDALIVDVRRNDGARQGWWRCCAATCSMSGPRSMTSTTARPAVPPSTGHCRSRRGRAPAGASRSTC
ncbi:hypothetical protein [Planomonospora parontospora]|uniref:hypothetical protein n=1 Tax=Planomonospora parontospora TaxID=58119 RepID=UPI00166FB579|nr:hypothetical protein [Planomonospora parontospora]